MNPLEQRIRKASSEGLLECYANRALFGHLQIVSDYDDPVYYGATFDEVRAEILRRMNK